MQSDHFNSVDHLNEWNARVFNDTLQLLSRIVSALKDEAALWGVAGAKQLGKVVASVSE